MAPQPKPQTAVNLAWVDPDGRPSLSFRQYLPTLDAAVRGLVSFFGTATFATQTAPGKLIAVAAPSNANATTAGVAVGQLYTDTADPAKVYIRTV